MSFCLTKFLFSATTPRKGTVFKRFGNLRPYKVAQNPPHNPQRKTPKFGYHTKKNRFVLQKELVPEYSMPDLEGCEYLPYVSKKLFRTYKGEKKQIVEEKKQE